MTAWDFVVRSVVLALALLVLMRIVGKRLVGEVAAVDLVVGITVGTIAGSTAISDKIPLWGGLLALLVWGLFEWVIVFISSRSPVFESLVSGRGTTLVREGSLDEAALRRVMLSHAALRSMLRERRRQDLSEVGEAVLEPSGRLGVVRRKPSS